MDGCPFFSCFGHISSCTSYIDLDLPRHFFYVLIDSNHLFSLTLANKEKLCLVSFRQDIILILKVITPHLVG